MAGTGIADSIMFMAALIVSVAFIGVFGAVIADANQQLGAQGERVSSSLQTEIIILNDPGFMQTNPLVLLLQNTGTTTLSVDGLAFLLDGQVSGNVTYDVLGGNDTFWPPGAVLQATVQDLTVSPGEHRVRVITENAVQASLRFQA